jgi:DNA-binding MarR family transcriptional regulator
MHLNYLMPADPCICISTRKAANALTNLYDEALEKSGIKVTQYSLLKTIDRSSEITINELSKQTKLNRTTLTRNLAILESDELIELISDPEDLRKSIVRLTKSGEKTLKKAQTSWEEVQKKAKKVLGKDLEFYVELNRRLSELSQSNA